jgi:hypothetical protein
VLTTLAAIFKQAQRGSNGPLKNKPNAAQLADRVKISNEEEMDKAVTPDMVYNADELKKLITARSCTSFFLSPTKCA